MPVKELTSNTPTTIGCTVGERARVRRIADERGMEKQRVVGLLLEGWGVLTPEQEAEASRRFAARSNRRSRKPAAATA
jgi:hypothetical protein